jgi:outer membrane protein assembly factor BamB
MRRLALAVFCVAALAGCTSSGNGGTASTPPPPPVTSSTPAPSTAVSPSTPGTSSAPPQPADWPMYHGTLDRSGYAPGMPAVAGPLKVVRHLQTDGPLYAAPVVAGGILVVATEANTVYAYKLDGTPLWKRNLGAPSPQSERPCGNIDPLGVTGTPIVSNETVYVSPELGGPPRHQLVALDLRTGKIEWQRDIDLAGVETAAMQERGALTVANGRVWVPFGGLFGDCGGYKGRVVGVPLDGTGATIAYTVPTTREAGIWTPPGPAVDASGNLYVAVGNGESGVGDPYDFSDSILKIGADGKLADSFSPTSWPTDNDADLDLGSQGPALVGQWVFSAGKSGTAYVLRRDHLGGIGGQVSQQNVCVSFGGTAVVGDVVYVPCTDGVRAVRIDSAGTMHVLWHVASSTIAGSPVVGGGRVWALDQQAGVLHALDPKTGERLDEVDVGVTSRFATPAIYGKYVLVPTLTGLTVVATS